MLNAEKVYFFKKVFFFVFGTLKISNNETMLTHPYYNFFIFGFEGDRKADVAAQLLATTGLVVPFWRRRCCEDHLVCFWPAFLSSAFFIFGFEGNRKDSK